jgi:hypothetical protein
LRLTSGTLRTRNLHGGCAFLEEAAEMGQKAVDTARDLADKAGKKIDEMKK